MTAQVKLVGLTVELWCQFQALYRARSYPIPPQPAEGIWVVDSQGSPVGGLCIYFPAGPFCILEHAVLDPSKPLKLRMKAFELGLDAARAYCAMRGVVPKCTVTTPGMVRFLKRRGWHTQTAVPMYLWPLELVSK